MTTIKAELLRVMEKRQRREYEESYREFRASVKLLYEQLRSQQVLTAMPPLSAFSKLPVFNVLQGVVSVAPRDAAKVFKQIPLINELLLGELKKWIEQAKTLLGAPLGFPNWKTASKNTLHPVERLTGRFQCQRCHQVPIRYQTDECLDFAGACAHECATPSKKRLKGWDAGCFVKDEKVRQ